jgi:hypothetical protein
MHLRCSAPRVDVVAAPHIEYRLSARRRIWPPTGKPHCFLAVWVLQTVLVVAAMRGAVV